MGSSLLTMAWGVEAAGLPVALILVALMAALCLYTAYVLLRVNSYHGSDSCEVPALCHALLGRWAAVVAHTFSLLVLLGANVVYWILITNFLYFTVNYFTGKQYVSLLRYQWATNESHYITAIKVLNVIYYLRFKHLFLFKPAILIFIHLKLNYNNNNIFVYLYLCILDIIECYLYV
ncbi:unnamed protein product [Diatraea saccharalis]|uniref:Amino acid transporter transmembrane domain-containing protein n=1 Tax=Diatraea saccharalis TaxID=40085 RepID=A0A9N9WEE8_9NEOP|nr:unnamed protein product [Diatraea saccharalis]